MNADLVQVYDPRTEDHVLIDMDARCILARKQTPGPYEGVPMRGTTYIQDVLEPELARATRAIRGIPIESIISLGVMLTAVLSVGRIMAQLSSIVEEGEEGKPDE